MDFESPDVMKDFPGLYSTEVNKKCNDSDYSDDVNEKSTKKDLLIGKRKDKKDSKKDRGYAALEGESSAEEDFDAKSPSKSKKSKSFKFTTKTKEKRDKFRDKEKDVEKKKDKDNRKNDRCKEKVKCDKKDKKVKLVNDEKVDIADVLPIFGVSLELAVERGRCHDNIDLPLPVRNCIDYVQEHGISVENVYKIGGIKSKVLHIKKMYNQREFVNLAEYDTPTATSVFKLFFRELPEPVLTDLLTQFEEAAAIQDVGSREISLMSLVEKLPTYNRILLAWTILHLDTITNNEKLTKMNAQSIAMALSPTLLMSHRLLTALLCHCKSLFKDTVLFKYCPPLIPNTVQLPEESVDILCELRKQESLLAQIHMEMNSGIISKKREELLWEVQRMITNLKRKLRSIQKCNEMSKKSFEEFSAPEESKMTKSLSCSDDDTLQQAPKTVSVQNQQASKTVSVQIQQASKTVSVQNQQASKTVSVQNQQASKTVSVQNQQASKTVSIQNDEKVAESTSIQDFPPAEEINCVHENSITIIANEVQPVESTNTQNNIETPVSVKPPSKVYLEVEAVETLTSAKPQLSDAAISLIQHQNNALMELKDSLLSQIAAEKSEVVLLKYCIANNSNNQQQIPQITSSSNIDTNKLDEFMDLISKENKILQIKKIDLVREIMEQREACIYLQSKLSLMSTNVR